MTIGYVPQDETTFIEAALKDPNRLNKEKEIMLVCMLARMQQSTCATVSENMLDVIMKIQRVWGNLK